MEEGLKEKEQRPPRWAERFVEWYCKPQLVEDLLGDLNEYFERNVRNVGLRRARMIYMIDAIKFFRAYTVRKPKVINLLINWIMIGSYLKTSGRNVLRNKLFSSINIVGLAISMSVGLLMIAFLHDLLSYDTFHTNGDRIYRLISRPTIGKQEWGPFATSSIRAGKMLQDDATGFDAVTIMRKEFGGDARIGDKVIPIEGLYAEPSFFDVFTFPMLKGDVTTALKEPNSIVLTEASALKLFGTEDAFGKPLRIDTIDYQVTGIVKDIPFFSHLRFESLISLSTYEARREPDLNKFDNMWSNMVYVLVANNADMKLLQSNLDAIAAEGNKENDNFKLALTLQPMSEFVLGVDLSNNYGPTMPKVVVWIIAGLTIIVILSACFNYTNLSIARGLRRFKEIGLRKVIGAGTGQVRQQFIYEAVIVAVASLVISFALFLILRQQFMNMAPELKRMVQLEVSPVMIMSFVVFAILVGVMAGFLPAVFFSKVGIIQALKETGSVRALKGVSMRKGLVVVQYTLTLIFITTTVIGYNQYKKILAFDLGFNTDNVINIYLQGNKPDALVKGLSEIPEVQQVSKSMMVTSIGNYWGGMMRYQDPNDSSQVWYNAVDENYIPLHGHKFVAGGNFVARPTTKEEQTEVIVNEQVLKRFNIKDQIPAKALGEQLILDGRKLSIVGVLKDFHSGKADNKIEPFVFRYYTQGARGVVNAKISASDPLVVRTKIEQVWKEVDPIHPLNASWYKESIEDAYSEFSAMLKIIGFMAFLAISIASLGMFGMVVFTTETRLREIGIRKVMGATPQSLILLLSRGFLILLSIASIIAIPVTWIFFEKVVLVNFPYHDPVSAVELFAGLLGVFLIAFLMIGSQTFKAARTNPAQVLKGE